VSKWSAYPGKLVLQSYPQHCREASSDTKEYRGLKATKLAGPRISARCREVVISLVHKDGIVQLLLNLQMLMVSSSSFQHTI